MLNVAVWRKRRLCPSAIEMCVRRLVWYKSMSIYRKEHQQIFAAFFGRAVFEDVDPIDDDFDLVGIDAAAQQVGLEGIRERNDGDRLAVEVKLQLFHQTQTEARSHGADGDDGSGPEVTELKDERDAPRRASLPRAHAGTRPGSGGRLPS